MSGQQPDERILTNRLDLLLVTADDGDALSEVFLDKRLYAFTGGGPGT